MPEKHQDAEEGPGTGGLGCVALKEGYLRAYSHRVKLRRGWAKAIVVTGHKILTIAFHMLRNNQPYRELGHDHFDRLNPARTTRKLIQRLEALGHSGSPFARGVKCVNPAGSAFTGVCFLRTPRAPAEVEEKWPRITLSSKDYSSGVAEE